MKIEYFLKRKGDVSPIYIALYQEGIAELIFTGQRIATKDWGDRKPKNQNSDIYHAIEAVRNEVVKVRRKMEVNELPVTPFTLKKEYKNSQKAKSEKQSSSDQKAKTSLTNITALIDKWMKTELGEYQPSTKAVIKTSLRMFQAYIKKYYPRLEKGDLTLDILNDYSKYLEEKKKLKDSTHGKKIKQLRWFLDWIKFDELKQLRIRTIKPGERNIIHLTISELEALEAVDVSESKEKQKAKDMFLLGCYTGMRVSDLKRINPHRVNNDAIELTLKKNRTTVSIPILQQTKAILERYNYFAPKISEQQVNESIKEVCKDAGIDKKVFFKSVKAGLLIETLHPKYELITTHVAGKTFISLAGERWGLSPTDIAAIVGKDIKTILGYYLKPDAQIAKQKMIEADNRSRMKAIK